MAVSACGYAALELLKRHKLGGATSAAINVVSGIASGVAGNSAHATAIDWLKQTRDHWSRLDPEKNHDLLRAAMLSSLMANYRAGVEFARSAELRISDLPVRMPLPEWARDWLRRPRTPSEPSIAKPDDQYWLDVYLNQTVKQYDACLKPQWDPPKPNTEIAKILAHPEQVKAPKEDVEAAFANALTTEALEGAKANNLGTPPPFEDLFRELWFPFFQSAFQAHLKNNQKVANIFFADLLSTIVRSKVPGSQLPATVLDPFRSQIYEHFDSKFDVVVTMLDRMDADAQVRHTEVMTGIEGIGRIIQPVRSDALNPDWSRYKPLEPDKLPPVTELPAINWMPYGSLKDRFVGRVAELWNVHRNLKGPWQVASISGFAGLGKTQLAIEYAWRFARCYPGGVFWIEAERGRESILDLLQFAEPSGWKRQGSEHANRPAVAGAGAETRWPRACDLRQLSRGGGAK